MSIAKNLFAAEQHSLPPITLHILKTPDATVISEILCEMEPWRTLGYTQNGLQNYLCNCDPALKRYGLWRSGEIVGVVCVRYPWLRGPYLELLAVFPLAQGCGIGREIVRWMEEESRVASNSIWTITSEFNENARKFYRAIHFVEVVTLPNLVATGYNEILLRKIIHPQ